MELYPNEISLIKHSNIQLKVKGGPRSDHTIEFWIMESETSKSPHKVVNITQSGVVHAFDFGEVLVGARAVMSDGSVFNCKVLVCLIVQTHHDHLCP